MPHTAARTQPVHYGCMGWQTLRTSSFWGPSRVLSYMWPPLAAPCMGAPACGGRFAACALGYEYAVDLLANVGAPLEAGGRQFVQVLVYFA